MIIVDKSTKPKTKQRNAVSEPSKKAPELEKFLEESFRRTSSIQADTCDSCKKPATAFRDDLSRKEYTISGLCQECQDSVFGA